MIFLFLIAALIGAYYDHRYLQAGGQHSTATERNYLIITIGIVAVVLIGLVIAGFNTGPEGIGSMAAVMGITIFSLWQFSRWRIRRRNPIIPVSKVTTPPKATPAKPKTESDFPEYI
jgi:hypothetical protein